MATITRRGGRWQAQVCVKGVRRAATRSTKRDALAWAADTERELQAGIGKLPNKAFGDLLDRYEREVSRAKRGYRWEAMRIGLFQRDPIAGVKVSDLAAPNVAAWRDRRLQKVSAASVRREWNLLSHACNLAVREWHWLRENPFSVVKRPASPPPRDRRISEDEIERILLGCGYEEPPRTATARVGAAFLFAIETAMRAGEIAGLTWGTVHEKYVHLARTKNGNARDVPLSPEAGRLLELLRQVAVGDSVFQLTGAQIDALFRKVRRRTMIEDLHFHDTRREALTRLSRVFDVMELAKISGHRDLRILQAVYYAPSADDLAEKLRKAGVPD